MARMRLTRDLDCAIEFSEVGIRLPRARKRKVNARLRRFAGEASPEQVWRLRGISFRVEPGQAVAVVGRRNAGREALLRLAAGTLIADEGRVRRRDLIVPMIDVAGALAPNMTVRQNIYVIGGLLGDSPNVMGDRIKEIARLAGLQGQVDRTLAPLSARQRNRLAWAIGISAQEKVFAIDSGHLEDDPEYAHVVKEHLMSLQAAGVTFLISTERPELLLDHWDRGLVLSGGAIVADTSIDEAVALFAEIGGADDEDLDEDRRIDETLEERDDLSEEEVWVEEEPDERLKGPARGPRDKDGDRDDA